MTPEFLTVQDVLDIHDDQLVRFGGARGIRDLGLLESAVAQPRATFAGHFVHANVHAMAAAYWFHLAANHPFVDGNKRVALASALVFLDLNGCFIPQEMTETLYSLTMQVAAGDLTRDQLEAGLRDLLFG